jgi:hypothetical protein
MDEKQKKYIKIQTKYRAKYLQLAKKLEEEYGIVAGELYQKVKNIIDQYKLDDGTISKKTLNDIKDDIDQAVNWFQAVNTRWIDNNIVKSANIAISGQDKATKYYVQATLAEKGASAAVIKQILNSVDSPLLLKTQYGDGLTKKIRDQIWKTRWSDGWKLSDRSWKSSQIERTNLHSMIEQCVNEGRSAVEFSRAVADYLEVPGPAWTTAIKPSVTGRGTIKYNALRLARTETNNAYRKAQDFSAAQSSIVKGIKWNLSGSHPKYDICDIWASQDLYKLGPGVYPAGLLPPGHPNCLCFCTDVLYEGDELIERIRNKYTEETTREKGKKSSKNFGKYGIIKNVRYPISQVEIDNILNTELKNVRFSVKPTYNSRVVTPGKTRILLQSGNAKIKTMEIGKQNKSGKAELVNTLLHEELEARIAVKAYNRYSERYRLIIKHNDSTIHPYINKVIKRFFRLKGWTRNGLE